MAELKGLSLYMKLLYKVNHSEYKILNHHKIIIEALERVIIGDTSRLIINIPPRYGKTELIVRGFISYAMGLHPRSNFILTSYSKRLASFNGLKAREACKGKLYETLFPNARLDRSITARDLWGTTLGGKCYADGAGGSLTGFGAGSNDDDFGGAIIIDDPHKASDISQLRLKRCSDWYVDTVQSRVNTPDTPIIVIMQRLNVDDLTGFLLAGGSGETWEHINIPVCDDSFTDCLWDEKHSLERLRDMSVHMGRTFQTQYMQNPQPMDGGLFIRKYLSKSYTVIPEELRIYQSWDTAYKVTQTSDYAACCTVGVDNQDNIYILNVTRGKFEFNELLDNVKRLEAEFNPDLILIEDKGSGITLIQVLNDEGHNNIEPIVPNNTKFFRAQSTIPMLDKVLFPEHSRWNKDFFDEFFIFPYGSHDDQVDAFSQILNYLSENDLGRFLWGK